MEKPSFSKVSATFSDIRGPLAEFGGPRTGPRRLQWEAAKGPAEYGIPRCLRGARAVRGIPREIRAETWKVGDGCVIAVVSRSAEYRARIAQTHKLSVYCSNPRGFLADHARPREDRAGTVWACSGLFCIFVCLVLLVLLY